VDIVKQAADNAQEYVTIKWDGCIHPDLKIRTNKGVFRIEEVIDRYLSGEDFKVVAHDFETGADVSTNINHAVKEFGNKSWVEIELENGEILRMTADHEVFTTNRGWVQAQHLTDSDDIKTSENN
jgi:intein/homing endonuclease